MLRFLAAMTFVAVAAAAPSALRAESLQASPAELAEALLAADRAFARASAGTDAVSGISAMFADDVVMPAPGGSFTHSREEAVAALRANPLNLVSRAEWAPIRAGVSADGTQGFTIGYMTLRDSDASVRRAKYLSYWVRGPQGWRVAVYKRAPQGEGEFSTAMMAPVLPSGAAVSDAAALEDHRKSLDAAERGFSDEAQAIGLGPAFCKHGAPDATNLGGPAPSIINGVDNICREIGGSDGSGPSSVRWQPDAVLVAASGDLGITWGMIRPNGPVPEGQPAAFPYTTVWHRADPGQPWKYIAE